MKLGPSNRWAMFDQKTGTQTVRPREIVAEVAVTGRIDTVALLNLDAAAVNVTMLDGATEVYNQDVSLVSTSGITNFWRYLFEPIRKISDVALTGLPVALDPQVTVTLTGSGDVKAGQCVIGLAAQLGLPQFGSRLGITDNSKKVADDFGNWTILERSYAKRNSHVVEVARDDVDFVYDLLASYRATAVVLIGSNLYRSTFQFGLLKDWSLSINYVTHSLLSIDFEGI